MRGGYVKFPRAPLDPRLAKLHPTARWLYHRLVLYARWEAPDTGALLNDNGKPMGVRSMERISCISRSEIGGRLKLLIDAGLIERRQDGVLIVSDYDTLYCTNGLQYQPEDGLQSQPNQGQVVGSANQNGWEYQPQRLGGQTKTVGTAYHREEEELGTLEETASTSLVVKARDPFDDDEPETAPKATRKQRATADPIEVQAELDMLEADTPTHLRHHFRTFIAEAAAANSTGKITLSRQLSIWNALHAILTEYGEEAFGYAAENTSSKGISNTRYLMACAKSYQERGGNGQHKKPGRHGSRRQDPADWSNIPTGELEL